MIKLVMFDFDGTIADSFGVILEVFERLNAGKRKLTLAEINELRNKPYPEILKFLDINILKVPGLVIRGRRMLRQNIHNVKPFEGMADMLHELKQAQCHLAILSSNSPQNITQFLETHGLTEYFDTVQGNVGLFSKTKVIRKITKQLNCAVKEVAYIGDEPRDVDAAHKAGVHAIAVTWGFAGAEILHTHNPTALISKPKDLVAVLGKL